MDLTTRYLGLELKHPIVASAGPISHSLDGIRRLEDCNAAAVVMFSLFEEQIRQDRQITEERLAAGADSFAESLSYFPQSEDYEIGPEPYLNLVQRAVGACDIPIIASLNGVTDEGWIDYARLIQEAGAAAIELNIYYIAADLETSSAEVEQRYVDVLRAVKQAVDIPVALKLGPYFSAFGAMARRLAVAGADGLVLFNRFYQPDFDLEALAVAPTLELSQANDARLPLLWIALLGGRLNISLAATSGVQTADEVVKYLLAGADVAMTTSSLLRNGPEHLAGLVRGLTSWMSQRGYDRVADLRGIMSQRHADDPAFERANYIKVLQSYG